MDYNKSGGKFTTAGGDGCLNIYDSESGQCSTRYQPTTLENGSFQRIFSVTFHPEQDNIFLAGGWNGKVRLYDLRSPKHCWEIYDQFICGEGISFQPSGNEFCTASWSPYNTLQIYDYKTVSRIRKFDSLDGDIDPKSDQRHPLLSSSLLYSAKYYGNGSKLLVAGAEPSTLTLIDATSGKLVAGVRELPQSVYCLNVCGGNAPSSVAVMIMGNEVALLDFFL